MKKEVKSKYIDNIIKKTDDKYEISWDNKGAPVYKNKSKIKKGKISRASGARFELKVRDKLEKDGWIVDKWTNNIDLETKKLVKAKRKFNPYFKALSIGTGFPDFVAIKRIGKLYNVVGGEVKKRGYLDKEEKEKCSFYLENKIFSKILIAKSKKNGRSLDIEYKEFE